MTTRHVSESRLALTRIAAQLDPVRLEHAEGAALQVRFDRKYVVSPRQLHQLVVGLHDRTKVLQVNERRTSTYQSWYFDTPTLASYRGAAQGRRRRFKVRSRTYVDDGACFLEVKLAGARDQTVKDRIPYVLDDRERLTEDGECFVRSLLPDLGGECLSAVVCTEYERLTLVDAHNRFRVTCDSDVTCRRADGVSHAIDDLVVVETKSSGPPTVADRLLWAHGCRPVTISKFGVAMAMAHPGLGANKWNRVLRQHFGWAPVPAGPDAPACGLVRNRSAALPS